VVLGHLRGLVLTCCYLYVKTTTKFSRVSW
jgi:hypothetical protein